MTFILLYAKIFIRFKGKKYGECVMTEGAKDVKATKISITLDAYLKNEVNNRIPYYSHAQNHQLKNSTSLFQS